MLSALIITYCSALIVPASIGFLAHLVGFEIYNSTIVDWSKKAAIRESLHREMKYVMIIRPNMTRLPEGLLEPLPLGLIDVQIAVSNLMSLPDDLDTRWGHALSILSIEQCQLEEFSVALTRLQVKDLSLYRNRLTSMNSVRLSDDFDKLTPLVLSRMPLRELPATIPANIQKIELVSLENMQIATFPHWVKEAAAFRASTTVFASDTPFCNAQSEHMIATEYGQHAVLSCVAQSAFFYGRLLLEFMTQMRVP